MALREKETVRRFAFFILTVSPFRIFLIFLVLLFPFLSCAFWFFLLFFEPKTRAQERRNNKRKSRYDKWKKTLRPFINFWSITFSPFFCLSLFFLGAFCLIFDSLCLFKSQRQTNAKRKGTKEGGKTRNSSYRLFHHSSFPYFLGPYLVYLRLAFRRLMLPSG